MAAAISDPSVFPLFSGFPLELRRQIWRDALPVNIGPALYYYKNGCWGPRRLAESDEEYDHEDDRSNLLFEFRHDLLDDAQFEVPLVFVNREARGIAVAWAREQGIEIRGRHYPVFVRPFDPTCDALYIANDQWDDFLRDPVDRHFQPDLLDQFVGIRCCISRIAISEALLRSEIATLCEIFEYFIRSRTILIIVDTQPDLQSADNDRNVQRRWEFESTQGGGFFWNDEHSCFDCKDKELGDSENISHEGFRRLLDGASKGLSEGLARNHVRSLEIRPVSAIRK